VSPRQVEGLEAAVGAVVRASEAVISAANVVVACAALGLVALWVIAICAAAIARNTGKG
jgi:nitroreductase